MHLPIWLPWQVQVTTWGVFPRPSNISEAYGGGRDLKPGQALETPQQRAAREASYASALAAYKVGRRRVQGVVVRCLLPVIGPRYTAGWQQPSWQGPLGSTTAHAVHCGSKHLDLVHVEAAVRGRQDLRLPCNDPVHHLFRYPFQTKAGLDVDPEAEAAAMKVTRVVMVGACVRAWATCPKRDGAMAHVAHPHR